MRYHDGGPLTMPRTRMTRRAHVVALTEARDRDRTALRDILNESPEASPTHVRAYAEALLEADRWLAAGVRAASMRGWDQIIYIDDDGVCFDAPE